MIAWTGATILTMADGGKPASAVAFDGGRLVAVGGDAEVLAAAGRGASVRDLGGAVVLPGFIDAHHHLSFCLLYELGVDCHPAVTPTRESIVARLRAAASTTPPGQWVVGIGYDEWSLDAELTRDVLDAACPEHPVLVLQYTAHEAVANSRALELAGIGSTTESLPGGIIVRDRQGRATGRLIERAMLRVEALAREAFAAAHADRWVEQFPTYEDRLFAVGITRLADPIVPPVLEALYRRARAEGRQRVPIVIMPLGPGCQIDGGPAFLEQGPTGSGDDLLCFGPLKLILDGAERCAMCLSASTLLSLAGLAIRDSLRERSFLPLRVVGRTTPRLGRDLHFHNGMLFYDLDGLRKLTTHAVDRGFGLAIHGIGDEAVSMALDAIEPLRGRIPGSPRVEHALFVNAEICRRAGDLGVTFVTQPDFLTAASEGKIPSFPHNLTMLPQRTMADSSVRVVPSSDYPGSRFDPLLWTRMSVNRACPGGRAVHAEEAVDAMSVLRGATRHAADTLGCLDVAGTIEVGKRADLVVLSADPRTALNEARVVETWLGGERVFPREGPVDKMPARPRPEAGP